MTGQPDPDDNGQQEVETLMTILIAGICVTWIVSSCSIALTS